MPSASSINLSQYTLPNDQPVVSLDAKEAFKGLSKREQLYAHYISRASFYGGLIVLIQTSPEAPHIFRLIQRINTAQKTAELKEASTKAGVSEADFTAYLVYCCGVYANMGNYKGFGDSKIVPNLPVEQFEALVRASAAFASDKASVEAIWASVKAPMYTLTDRQKQLGLGCKGVSTYFSDNCEQDDSDKINKYFKEKQMEGYINRAFKTVNGGKVTYEIRNAGVNVGAVGTEEFEGATFNVTSGDYSPLMKLVCENLEKAKENAANDEERDMLKGYIKSFNEGSLDAHKEGSRHWIRNKGPAVETYIGFIETYRDPVGMRGEFEGFAAMVNKEQSAKFQSLVDAAENILPRLPWPKEFEKDKFLLPDFTSLDVLTFAGSGVPAGINIPNYDEIRQSEGFKNVNLGNVISSSYKAEKKTTFVNHEDHEILDKWRVKSFEVQVGLHELLGHGSGKLLMKKKDGSLNFDSGLENPLTGKPVEDFYEAGETYDSKFTSMGSSYEECRAEAVGLYLSTFKDVVEIFGFGADTVDDVIYANWLSLCHAAVKGVEMYSPASKEWKQAHSQARFVLLHVMLNAGEGFVDVKELKGEDGNPDLLLTMDRSKLVSVGKPAMGEFLKKLQVLKSLGDVASAKVMYDELSEVRESGRFPFAKWRDIVVARKTPRKMLVQANTVVKNEALTFHDYDATPAGMVESWAERFPAEEFAQIDADLKDITDKDKAHFTSTA